ncbi:MAG: hypothetical protein H0V03_07730 [Thermoleophilaceae bacterium]|nr:hypothetical protein [Thermoleophilaceae bacterium]
MRELNGAAEARPAIPFATVRARLSISILCTLATALAVAAPALAENGEGLLGETDDRVVTFFAFGVLAFFPLVALIGTVVQGRLDRRKDRRKAAAMREHERAAARS